MESPQRNSVLTFIAVFKLLKAVLLLSVCIGLFRLLHLGIEDTIERWVQSGRIDPDNHFVHGALARLTGINPWKLQAICVGTILYTAIFAVEGVGLLLQKRWAEYLTVMATISFVPIEIYEIAKHPTATRVTVLVLNVAIAVYLIVRLRTTRKQSEGALRTSSS